MVTPSFSRYASNLLLTTPSAPTTASTTSRCLIPIVFQFVSSGPDISQSFNLPFHTLCDPSAKLYPLWLPCYFHSRQQQWQVSWSHWMVISHKILHFSFSLPLPVDVHTIIIIVIIFVVSVSESLAILPLEFAHTRQRNKLTLPVAFSVVSSFCESFGSFRSKNENDDEYEFVCFVSVRMRICPWHVTQVGNPLSAAR